MLTALQIPQDAIKKLPYFVRAGRIFFATDSGRESYLYTKHGMGFTNNLIQLLDDLQKGKIVRVWFNLGITGQVKIFLNDHGNLEGSYSSTDKVSLMNFRKLLETATT